MPLTVIPLAINIVIGGAIWASDLPTAVKVIITIVLTVKYLTYIYSALMADSPLIHNVGLVLCGSLDAAGIIYTAMQEIWTATIPFATLLALLIGWCVLPMINVSRKGGNKG